VLVGKPSVVQNSAPRRRNLAARLNASDRGFHAILRGGGIVVLALLGLAGTFLGFRGWQALHVAGTSFLTTQIWEPGGGGFGIAAVMVGTILIALVAVVVSVPLALGTALFISEYVPRFVRRFLITIVDLMAAIPSVIFGLWGFFLLQWRAITLSRWLNDWLGWIPAFRVSGTTRHTWSPTAYTSSTFMAGIVVALMITPLAASIVREAFSQAPTGEREGAYALGATRWGMIRAVVLPFGTGAMIGGTMLGLGRALGETIAVVMIISPVYHIQLHLLENGTSSISSMIALKYSAATGFQISALMAAGLALFGLTLVVNVIAAVIVSRSRSGAVSEA
jgi:phosphate transport system permease protein